MGTWAEIRDGFETRLETISGLVAHSEMPKTLPDKAVAVVLYGDPVIVPSGYASKVDVNVRVIIRCTRGDFKDVQLALDSYIWPAGANSIVAAINGDRTLGGKVDDTQWQGVSGVGVPEGAATSLQATVEFRCKVAA